MAGAASLTITYPLEFVRVRLAMDIGTTGHRMFNGFFDCCSKIIKVDGLVGLY